MANRRMDSRVILYSKVLLPKLKESKVGSSRSNAGQARSRSRKDERLPEAMLQERVWKGSGSRVGSDSYCGLDLSVCFMCEFRPEIISLRSTHPVV